KEISMDPSNSDVGSSFGQTPPLMTVSVMTPDQRGNMDKAVTPAPMIQFQVGSNMTPNASSPMASPMYTGGSNSNHNSPSNHDPSGFALSDFLSQLEDYTPTIPDAVANHFLHQAGFDSTDPRLTRLISIAAQKFISDIINESFTHCKLKGAAQVGKAKAKDKKYVLTLDDLIPVLNDYGITVRKPPYYV
ncbi:unnamed protein product, partial [Allacma fusca]